MRHQLDYVQTVPKHKLGKPVAHIPEDRLKEVLKALLYAFGFDK